MTENGHHTVAKYIHVMPGNNPIVYGCMEKGGEIQQGEVHAAPDFDAVDNNRHYTHDQLRYLRQDFGDRHGVDLAMGQIPDRSLWAEVLRYRAVTSRYSELAERITALENEHVQRGFHTHEKSPLNGGMNSVEMIPNQPAGPSDRRASVDVTIHSQKDDGLRPDRLASASASASPPPVMSIQVGVDHLQEVGEPLTSDLNPSPGPCACNNGSKTTTTVPVVTLSTSYESYPQTQMRSLANAWIQV
ncbi:hypothetical protein EI94DRAFT_1818433 [Lactarius quietus]|nr:hypothetical protein EI94DRAFT_1818433 [Lactarius quietus]